MLPVAGNRVVRWILVACLTTVGAACDTTPKSGHAFGARAGLDQGGQDKQPSPTWVLVGNNWVFVSADQPLVCNDTVCAAAPGSTVIVQRNAVIPGDNRAGWRVILYETKGTKPAKAIADYDDSTGAHVNKSKPFGKKALAYIDVDADHNFRAEGTFPWPLNFANPAPAGMDLDLFAVLKEVDDKINKAGASWP